MGAITSKGQVTIPKRIRDALGIKAGSEVRFEMDEDGRAFIHPQGKPRKSDMRKRIEKVRGTLKTDMTTDEIMKFLRGD
ncbi:MAG TPA: AbrB/MazE/SpoVT family DNA-binding domain-containing protein [Rhizomicrobium sp.]|nr:AbrB/MazE/SpoVT family DNA-binding domain-containing protein [Rhizomicrobium sp.]